MGKESSGSINLQQKKLKVMSEIAGIAKKGKNNHQKYNYIAVDDVINAFRSAFIKTKVSFYSTIKKWEQIGTAFLIEVEMKIINADNPEEFETYIQVGLSTRLDDTSVGKALAYAVKNGLLKVFLIPGGKGEDVEYYDNKPVEKSYVSPLATPPAPKQDVSMILEEIREADSLEELQATWVNLKGIYPTPVCKEAYPVYLKLKKKLSGAQ